MLISPFSLSKNSMGVNLRAFNGRTGVKWEWMRPLCCLTQNKRQVERVFKRKIWRQKQWQWLLKRTRKSHYITVVIIKMVPQVHSSIYGCIQNVSPCTYQTCSMSCKYSHAYLLWHRDSHTCSFALSSSWFKTLEKNTLIYSSEEGQTTHTRVPVCVAVTFN